MVESTPAAAPVLLVTDLDGTYLDEGGGIPGHAEDFAAVLKRRGIELIVATSRSPQNVSNLLRHLEPPYYAICSDGATTIKVGQTKWSVVAEENLESRMGLNLAETMSKCTVPRELFVFSSSRLQFAIYHFSADTRADSLKVLTETIGETRPVKSHMALDQVRHTLLNGRIRAISWFAAHHEIEVGRNELSEVLPHGTIQCLVYPEVRYPSYSWLDIISASSTKGAALERLLRSRTVRPQVIALGNGDNDVSLFEFADLSICPRDATENAKRAAKRTLNASGGNEFIRQVTTWLASDVHFHGGVK